MRGAASGRVLADFPVAGMALQDVVALVESVEPADVSDADVLAVVAGWQQVIDAATAAQAGAISELAARRGFSTFDPVEDEVALALSATRARAGRLVGRAHFLHRHPVVADAMRDGVLDAGRVDVLDEQVGRLPAAAAAAVLQVALPQAEGATTTQLRRLTARLVASVDPHAAATRAAKARAERCVSLRPGPDAMAWVHAYLPATDAVTVFSVVDALAGLTTGDNDERGVDARRADAFSDVFHAIAATGTLPDGAGLPSPQGHKVGVQVAVNASTLLGLDDLPGELAGYGPIPAQLARDAAAHGTWRAVLTDAHGRVQHVADRTHPAGPVAHVTHATDPPELPDERPPSVPHGEGRYRPSVGLTRLVTTRDPVCCFAGCAQPAWRCDLDHEDPYDPSDPAAGGATCACNLRPLCRRHHQLKTHAGWSITTDPLTGQILTRSPAGLTYRRPQPTLVTTSDPFATEPPAEPAPPPAPPSKYDDPPPF